jgi:hypothetical protein
MSYRKLSILVALFITVFGSVLWNLAYKKMVSDEQSHNAIINDLTVGDNHFSFIQGDGSCFGSTILNLHQDDHSFQIKVTGWVKIRLGKNVITPAVKGEVSLNPLGQIGSSVLYISIGDEKFRLGTFNINPITVAFVHEVDGKERMIQQNIPGPFELKENHNGGYLLTGPPITRSFLPKDPAFTAAASFVLPSATINREDTSVCSEGNIKEIDLSNLARAAQNVPHNFLDSLQSLIP